MKYQFELTFSQEDGALLTSDSGEPVGPIPVTVDFDPAREWAKFQVLCAGRADGQPVRAGDPEPVWDSRRGAPYVRAFSITATANGDAMACEFPLTYFAAAARSLSTYFVNKGRLKAGEIFHYHVTSRPAAPLTRGGAPQKSRLAVRRKGPAFDVHEDVGLDAMMRVARPYDRPGNDDMPVFVPQAVLDEVSRLTIDAGSLEAGGFLLGHLHRCPETGGLFLRVSEQIPAEFTQGELTKLSFSGETWTAARHTVRTRGVGEIMTGWWHCHNYLMETCKDCEKREQGACKAQADFFSQDDLFLHRTAFLTAFSIAMVASNSPCSGLTFALYGWRQGMIQRRGFYIVSNHTDTGGRDG